MVPVFPGREDDVLQVVEGRQPEERVFERVPGNLDVHALRRQFARELYAWYTGETLLEGEEAGRLAEVDSEAALRVSRVLGHNRVDIVVTYYLQD